MSDTLFKPTEAPADLDHLETLFRRISTEWEMFLTQSVKWPPHQRRAEIEAIIRYYLKHPPHRTADRFRFNTLNHRYRTNTERWARRLRMLEETGSARVGAGQRGRGDVEDLSRPQVLLSTRVRQDSASPEQLRDVYLAFRRARKARGQSVRKLSYREFAERIDRHLQHARVKAQGKPLELRVDEVGGKVRVAVRADKTVSTTR